MFLRPLITTYYNTPFMISLNRCLPCCEAFGQEFWIDGSNYKKHDTAASEWFPAWMVPQLKEGKPGKGGGKSESNGIVLKHVCSEITFTFKWMLGAKNKQFPVPVKVYRLELPDNACDFDGSDKCLTQLTRRPMHEMVCLLSFFQIIIVVVKTT